MSDGSMSGATTSEAPSALSDSFEGSRNDGEWALSSEESMEANRLLDCWRDHPKLNPTIRFPSIVVHDSSNINSIINSPAMQVHLASRLDLLDHLHTRMKVVRQIEGEKVVLLHPETSFNNLPLDIQKVCQPGPDVPMSFAYNQFTAAYSLLQLLPPHVHPPPTAFETIGHVIHMNLRPHHLAYRHLIGQVLLESLPHIQTVLIKVGEVSGPYRTYDFEIVAGENKTLVELAEAGLRLRFDVSQVYWCSRLSEERQRMLKLFGEGSTIADPFCGVGALCLLAAREKQCSVLANDWNPSAVEFFHQNIRLNGLDGTRITATCGDAYDFLIDLGLNTNRSLPHHVVMNYPLEAPKFLGALRWWPKRSQVVPRVHVYTFAKPTNDESAEDVAVDMIASNLIVCPSSGNASPRRDMLDDFYGCNVTVHAVRDVAPNKTVYCVSFSATPELIKAMQGDF